jgi:hypothetical protein
MKPAGLVWRLFVPGRRYLLHDKPPETTGNALPVVLSFWWSWRCFDGFPVKGSIGCPAGSGHRRPVREVAVQRNKLIPDARKKQAAIVPAVPEVEPGAAASEIKPRIQDVGKKGRHKPVFF